MIPLQSFGAHSLDPIKIYGDHPSPLVGNPVTISIKDSESLQNDGNSSLGEASASLPGVNSSGFSSASTRPVIRGFEGERISVLIDGMGTLDVSGTSQDHVVPINPLVVESLELVRGPYALLYGNSAIGGVLNVTSSRHHHERIDGVTGSVGSQVQSVNNLQNYVIKLDYGAGDWLFHVDGNYSSNQNLKVPTAEEKIVNSQAEQSSMNLGGTYLYGNSNSVSLFTTVFDNDYGVVAEEDVTIQTSQNRYDLTTENKFSGYFSEVSTQTAFSDYDHTEFEGDEVGTTFEQTSFENRIDLIHTKKAGTKSIWGVQTRYNDLTVAGDEAFLPSGSELKTALFNHQDFNVNKSLDFSFAARLEHVSISPDQIDTENIMLQNYSVANHYKINEKNHLNTQITYGERNANTQELFANGNHVAIGIFEVGDQNLKKEAAVGVETSFTHKRKSSSSSFTAFANRFKNYISLNDTGTLEPTDNVPIFEYINTEALLYGAELEFTQQLSNNLNLNLQSDVLIGRDLSNDTYLPRITPPRASVKLEYKESTFNTHIEALHNLEPLNLGAGETETEAYTFVNLGASKRIKLSNSQLRVYGKIRNLFDVEARNHSSFTKDIMQVGGLNVVLGVEASF